MKKRIRPAFAMYLCVILGLVLIGMFIGLRFLEPDELYPEGPGRETSKTVAVNGVDYFPRQDITVIMLLGIDESGPVRASGYYRNHGEADAVMLLILDQSEESYTLVPLNRDTMVQMPVLGLDGREAGTTYAQLALSHTYGEGLQDSCENSRKTVSAFLNNIAIDYYVAMRMDGISLVNDAVGGVTVTVTDDFSQVDSSLKMGQLTLQGQQALTYVQKRKDVGNQLNVSRMERQKEYMQGLLKALSARAAQDDSFALQLFEQVSDYIVTDCSVNVISGLINRCADYTLGEIVSPAGENVLGEEYYEFYVNEEERNALVLRLFYAPK